MPKISEEHQADLDKLQEAFEKSEQGTPLEILNAFMPEGRKVGEYDLKPVTFGHVLFLDKMDHPLSRGDIEHWKPEETAIAFLSFTRTSRELAQLIEEDRFKEELFKVVEEIPIGKVAEYTACLMAHYLDSLQTGLEMKDPKESKAQKKTRLGGFFRRFLDLLELIIGRWNMLYSTSRSSKV